MHWTNGRTDHEGDGLRERAEPEQNFEYSFVAVVFWHVIMNYDCRWRMFHSSVNKRLGFWRPA